jgi:hypothetical protein
VRTARIISRLVPAAEAAALAQAVADFAAGLSVAAVGCVMTPEVGPPQNAASVTPRGWRGGWPNWRVMA